MARYKRGQSGNPEGKRKGTPNVTTKRAREILNEILFAQIGKVEIAFNEIFENDKYKYLDILGKLLQFSLPRRTDLTTDDEPLPRNITITVADTEMADELKDFLNGTATNEGL